MAIFYDPQVHNYGGAAVAGIMDGLKIGVSAGALKKQYKEKKAAEEIGQLEASYGAKLTENKQAANALQDPEEPKPEITDPYAREYMGAEAFQTEQTRLLDYNKSKESIQKQRESLRSNGLSLRGELDTKIMETYNKYGLHDQAKAHRLQHYEIASHIGKNVGEDAALKYLQSGPDADLFEGATVAPDGKFKIIQLKDGSVIRASEKTGNYELIKSKDPSKQTVKIEKIINGDYEQSVALIEDDSGTRMEPLGKPGRRWKGDGSGGGGVEGRTARKEALAENKAYWDDIAKNMKATIENMDASDADKKKAQSVLNNLPGYRKLDSEAIRLGREPRNAQNVQDFINGVPGTSDGGNHTGIRDLGNGGGQTPVGARDLGKDSGPQGKQAKSAPKNGEIKKAPDGKSYRWNAATKKWQIQDVTAAQDSKIKRMMGASTSF